MCGTKEKKIYYEAVKLLYSLRPRDIIVHAQSIHSEAQLHN